MDLLWLWNAVEPAKPVESAQGCLFLCCWILFGDWEFGFILVDLNHLLILPVCETSENLIVEHGDLVLPLVSNRCGWPQNTTPKIDFSLGKNGVMNLYATLGSKMKFWNNIGLEARKPSSFLDYWIHSNSFVFLSYQVPSYFLIDQI